MTKYMLQYLCAPILVAISNATLPLLTATLSDNYGTKAMGVLYGIIKFGASFGNFLVGYE